MFCLLPTRSDKWMLPYQMSHLRQAFENVALSINIFTKKKKLHNFHSNFLHVKFWLTLIHTKYSIPPDKITFFNSRKKNSERFSPRPHSDLYHKGHGLRNEIYIIYKKKISKEESFKVNVNSSILTLQKWVFALHLNNLPIPLSWDCLLLNRIKLA